jgi:hypothetical protein
MPAVRAEGTIASMAANDPLLAEIAALLAAPDAPGDPARLERTLTDGYARALSLEGERWRLEQRIDQLAAAAESGDAASRRELSRLVRTHRGRDGDIRALRADLGRLRQRHSLMVRARV